MKTLRKWFRYMAPSALLLILIASCGGDGKESPAEGSLSFKLASSDIDLGTSKDLKVTVPYAGGVYKLSVKASPETVWSATVENGNNLLNVTPAGEQQGDGEIKITATEDSEKKGGKTGVVLIKNNADNIPLRISFEQKEKEAFFPEGLWGQSSADYQNPTSTFNVHYGKTGDNIVFLWARTIGVNPLVAPSNRRFDPDKALTACEDVYNFLVDELGFANRTTSYAAKYKFIVRVRDDDNGTAYGGGYGNVGTFEISPLHLQNDRYGIFYHEMCHCFQHIAGRDGAGKLSGPINEMTSQWALLRRFPNWIELERSHFNDFMKRTHLAFLHEDNGYHSPYVLEYWASKHGVNMVSRIWKEAINTDNSDPVVIYKRLTNIDQEQFNDEIYDAATRFITWDLPYIEKEYARCGGANVHTCELKRMSTNSYQIVPERCPSNYGYNGIKLAVPTAGTKIQLIFQGMMGAQGFNPPVNTENKGWRFGFLAVKNNGERVYGNMGKVTEGSGTIDFTVPENTQHLWLVVTGAPTKHWKHVVDQNNNNDEQWPYKFTLLNAEPDGQYCTVNN
ncbi:MAG: DUF6055 domain-containing protein [Bacteroides caccae]